MKNHFFSVFLSLQVWRQFIDREIPENLSCSERVHIYIRDVDCFIGKAIKRQLRCTSNVQKVLLHKSRRKNLFIYTEVKRQPCPPQVSGRNKCVSLSFMSKGTNQHQQKGKYYKMPRKEKKMGPGLSVASTVV